MESKRAEEGDKWKVTIWFRTHETNPAEVIAQAMQRPASEWKTSNQDDEDDFMCGAAMRSMGDTR